MRTDEEIKSDIESVNTCLNPLSLYKTDAIMHELLSRDESIWMRVPKNHTVLCRYWAIDIESAVDCIGGVGPCVVIMIKEEGHE